MDKKYDLVVIGGGSGGLTAAGFAAQLGASVALVEMNRLGGDCTWTGCVPSKALLKVARVAHANRSAGEYGILTTPPQVDMSAVRRYIQKTIAAIYQHETPEVLTSEGVEIIHGAGRFVAPDQLQVGERTISSGKFIICTGSRPNSANIPGLDSTQHFTNEQLFENDRLPDHLVVIGAGPVGVEMSQAYGRLGARVSLIDEALLPEQDGEAAAVLQRVFAREGIQFIKGLASSVSQVGNEAIVYVDEQAVPGDMLLVATGRQPNVQSLDLEKAGVRYDDGGIPVDSTLRTNMKHIYAAGDVIGGRQFTHLAAWQGFIAARNALLPGRDRRGLNKLIPSAIFTEPEIAQVGLTEVQARRQFGADLRIAHRASSRSDRAVCDNTQDGFLKIYHKANGVIVGATIVGDRAGESIMEFVLAMDHGLKLDDLAQTIHVYPSYTMDAMRLASDVAITNLTSGIGGSFVKKLVRLRSGLQPA